MDDLVTYALLASSAFFVVLAFGLLARYRQASQKITASTDMGKDLWQALEQRLRKQDERILDMMGRFDVIQSRVTDRLSTNPPTGVILPPVAPSRSTVPHADQNVVGVTESRSVARQPKSWAASQSELDETEEAALKLLSEKARSTIEIKEVLDKSREHTARLMKGLFDRGLVTRDDSTKPFVYQLTDEGRRYLS